jgi:signal transduction histidine kinase
LSQSVDSQSDTGPPSTVPDSPREGVWAGLIGVTFVVSMALAYRPTLDSFGEVVDALLPWLVLAGMVLAWSGRTFPTRLVGLLTAIAAWYWLIISDDGWSMLSFALYALCFIVDSTRMKVGLTLAGLVSAIWTVASLGGPLCTVLIPLFVFVAASTIAYAIHRIGRLTATQAELIRQLESTREDLATSERSRGVLEERTRLAGEIHDTLAQGFTSIVLLARTGKGSSTKADDTLESIEATAQENLNTARRLVESSRPDELEKVSLPDALRRHLLATLPENVGGDLEVVGRPVPLRGSVETVLLRAAQEGVRNACTHAQPNRVDLTLSYLDQEVTLGVRDDGIGFSDGQIHDRGTLTGGQGLATLSRRVESLSGNLKIEPGEERGSILTVHLPVGS